jgi:tRNA-splicing ligase RtcB (3'-phosphate/5'-hydroxy nucleic acid ligase)
VPVRKVLNSRVPIKVWTDDVETSAAQQLVRTGALPFVFRHVAAMPDTHWGMGATVGSVIATKDAICPAAVGVDIGCGMAAVKTSLPAAALEGKLGLLRASIERGIPVGFHQRREAHPRGAALLAAAADQDLPSVASDGEKKKAALQCGTLGGGNHFIEICVDQDDGRVWALLHSGSRNIGKVTAERHIGKAKGVMKRLAVDLPDPDLAYFATGTREFDAYVRDLQWCQDYARVNREIMLEEVLKDLRHEVGDFTTETPVNCHHNYVAWERHFGEDVMVTRKGAIRAGRGEAGIIPGSMGTGSFIVRGLGNAEAFESAPHGAGRKMSRGEARRRFTREDLAKQTEGVECRKDAGVLDEIPGAYKPIGEVIENSSDLVEVVARLKQVVCVKG